MAQISSPSAASNPAGPVQKQRLNVYTMMLILSFLAITTACILLWMELKEYGGPGGGFIERWWDTKSANPTVTSWLNVPLRVAAERAVL